MLPGHSCYIYETWRSKKVGGFKVIIWREVERRKPKSQRHGAGTFYGGVDSSGIALELPPYFSLF